MTDVPAAWHRSPGFCFLPLSSLLPSCCNSCSGKSAPSLPLSPSSLSSIQRWLQFSLAGSVRVIVWAFQPQGLFLPSTRKAASLHVAALAGMAHREACSTLSRIYRRPGRLGGGAVTQVGRCGSCRIWDISYLTVPKMTSQFHYLKTVVKKMSEIIMGIGLGLGSPTDKVQNNHSLLWALGPGTKQNLDL